MFPGLQTYSKPLFFEYQQQKQALLYLSFYDHSFYKTKPSEEYQDEVLRGIHVL